jgi:SnoaL-like polyketide cyclase
LIRPCPSSKLEDDHRLGRGRGRGLAIGAAPSQAATPVDSAKVDAGWTAGDLSTLPLADRHLSKREKTNLAVVLRAYHVAEGNSLDVPTFVNSFTKNGVFNDVVAGQSYRSTALGDVLNNMVSILPDVHRELKQITVHGDVVSIELSIQGTFTGSLPTPAGILKGNGARVDVPTADFWYLHNGKVEKFNCFVGYSAWFPQMGVNWDWASAVGKS